MKLRLLLALALCAGPSMFAAEKRPLNVLFLIADDLNNLLGCYGDPLAKTPNLDRLAERGMRFDRAYCAFPLCGPSRNSLLTGLYPNSTGIQANSQIFRQTIPQAVSLPQAFRQQGYYAGRIGKLYHFNVPNSIGTDGHDDPASWEFQINPAGVDRTKEHSHIFSLTPGSFGGTLSWLASQYPDAQHTDAKVASEAEWVLERCARQKDQPFFLAVGFFRPHTPYVAPKEPYFGHYPVEKMPVVAGVEEDQKDIPAAALASYKKEQDKLTDDLRREALQAYYASISFMDAQVGKILDALDRNGLASNTILVFTSDHGYHTGQHGLWQKQSLFEESARVPLLMVVPGVTQPRTISKTPVSHVDLFPTLAKAAGIEAPAHLQGQDLSPILRDPSAIGRGWALSQVVRGGNIKRYGASPAVGDQGRKFFGYSLRTDRWRYTEWDEGKQGRELYDHEKDPGELHNLAEDPSSAQTLGKLSAQLRAAVQESLPKDGKIPELRGGPESWPPQFID
ncbi:MAG: hypothetical protein RLZZ253_2974 [Verrucomicrobiota bacterium]